MIVEYVHLEPRKGASLNEIAQIQYGNEIRRKVAEGLSYATTIIPVSRLSSTNQGRQPGPDRNVIDGIVAPSWPSRRNG